MTAPVPGPPKPGQHFGAVVSTVSPEAVSARVDDLLSQVDAVRSEQAMSDADDPSIGLAGLARQAVLLEQAHQVLTVALEDVDRAT